jgi:hypothetical protein
MIRWIIPFLFLSCGLSRVVVAQTPSADIPQPENLKQFDPQEAMVTWSDRHWQVTAGTTVLKDFGPHEAEARQALRLIQELRLTHYGTIGRPQPVIEYWLTSGRPPQGFVPGLRVLPLQQDSLRVEAIQTQWCLRDAQRVLFNFGQHADDAQQALAVIRKYGFTHVGAIGQAAPSMLVFLARPGPIPMPLRVAPVPTPPRPGQGDQANSSLAGPGLTSPPSLGGLVMPALQPLQTPTSHGPGLAFGWDAPRGLAPVSARSLPSKDDQMECVRFDWRQVQMCQEDGSWKLMVGRCVLADLGPYEEDAQMALAALRHYRFSEHYRVGRPAPHFCYFLAGGQAPRGLMFGLSAQSFQPQKLTAERLGNHWAICEGPRVLVVLGEKPDEASQLLETIKQHKFDHLCRIGTAAGPGWTFLVRVN